MLKRWINKTGNPNCILFFNGWGMDEHAINHLQSEDHDVCMFSDYSDLKMELEKFQSYQSIYVIAWSLGVWVASQLIANSELKLTKAIAINGTEKPLDNEFGIPPVVFKGTLIFWNETNRRKFNQRVFGGKKEMELSSEKLPERDCTNQQDELAFLLQKIEDSAFCSIPWDCALIGKSDFIFSAKNQVAYWNDKTQIITKDLAHYPFQNYQTWQQLIDLNHGIGR